MGLGRPVGEVASGRVLPACPKLRKLTGVKSWDQKRRVWGEDEEEEWAEE